MHFTTKTTDIYYAVLGHIQAQSALNNTTIIKYQNSNEIKKYINKEFPKWSRSKINQTDLKYTKQ